MGSKIYFCVITILIVLNTYDASEGPIRYQKGRSGIPMIFVEQGNQTVIPARAYDGYPDVQVNVQCIG